MDKSVKLVDELMNAIIQMDEWDQIQLRDPDIARKSARLNSLLDRLKASAPPALADLVGELEGAALDAACSYIAPAIMYGLHIADAIRDVSSRPWDLSRYVMQRIGGITD